MLVITIKSGEFEIYGGGAVILLIFFIFTLGFTIRSNSYSLEKKRVAAWESLNRRIEAVNEMTVSEKEELINDINKWNDDREITFRRDHNPFIGVFYSIRGYEGTTDLEFPE